MIAVDFIIRPPHANEFVTIATLVRHTFDTTVAPTLTQEGRATFYAYALSDIIANRHADGHLTFVATRGAQPIGMVQLKLPDHLCMLFVEPTSQGQGIGRALTNAVIDNARMLHPTLAAVTVNASPNAVSAYLRFGFIAMGEVQTINGIRFVAMRKTLN